MAVFLVVIAIISILLIYSKLVIEIKELDIVNTKIGKFKVVISLELFNKIKWLKLTIDDKKIAKLKNNTKLKALDKILNAKILKQYKDFRQIKNLKKITRELKKIKIEKIRIKLTIGTENPAVTALTVGTLSTALSIILAKITTLPAYKIKPIYINKNYTHLSINCIIAIKMVHIISIKNAIKMKGSVPKVWKKIK